MVSSPEGDPKADIGVAIFFYSKSNNTSFGLDQFRDCCELTIKASCDLAERFHSNSQRGTDVVRVPVTRTDFHCIVGT
ncbi:hypothetical protein E2C01_005619 [Portunus trituberculatus]|uniref:Uncharacterized protein n=1 Tax=Portunus trituberculatus TaxID=210409 RepID=A0A5B7CVZ6_PORTR|nr:hypothetical protein [Portunus trituberculatus]